MENKRGYNTEDKHGIKQQVRAMNVGCLEKMVQYRKENTPKCSKYETLDIGCEENATIRMVIFAENFFLIFYTI